MSQVILDSDEEEDVSVEETVEDALVPDKSPIESRADARNEFLSHIEQGPGIRATSSSEKLRRDIEYAQSALVEPTPSGKRRAADDLDLTPSINSPDESRFKRGKSADAQEQRKIRSLRTYSKSTRTTKELPQTNLGEQWEVPEGLDHGTLIETKDFQTVDGIPQKNQTSPNDTIMDSSSQRGSASSRHIISVSESGGFDSHNPNELFPDLSSTSTGESSAAKSRSSRAAYRGQVSVQLQKMADSHISPKHNASGSQPDELQTENTPIMHEIITNIDPTRLQQPVVVVQSKEEQVTVMDAKPSSQQGKKRKLNREASVDELGPDQLSDLPKETYSPRPTRSRGAHKEPEQPNFAFPATPVKKSNSKLKRLRTTGSIALAERTTLCEMGFRPSQADEALAEAEGDVNRAVELLTRRGYEVSKTRKSRSGRSRRKLAAQDHEIDLEKEAEDEPAWRGIEVRDCEQDRADVIQNEPTPLAPVSVPNLDDADNRRRNADLDEGETNSVDEADNTADSSAAGMSKRAKGSVKKQQELMSGNTEKENTTERDEEDELQTIKEAPAGIAECNEPKKKGRGRPKTRQSTIDESADCIAVEMEPPEETVSREPLAETDANREHIFAATENSPQKSPAAEGYTDQVPSENNLKTASGSPHKAHSPINKGKVPFKVGLSRRVRIEPLLRVVRK